MAITFSNENISGGGISVMFCCAFIPRKELNWANFLAHGLKSGILPFHGGDKIHLNAILFTALLHLLRQTI